MSFGQGDSKFGPIKIRGTNLYLLADANWECEPSHMCSHWRWHGSSSFGWQLQNNVSININFTSRQRIDMQMQMSCVPQGTKMNKNYWWKSSIVWAMKCWVQARTMANEKWVIRSDEASSWQLNRDGSESIYLTSTLQYWSTLRVLWMQDIGWKGSEHWASLWYFRW